MSNIAVRFIVTAVIISSIAIQWVLIYALQCLYIALTCGFTTKEHRQDICGHIFRKVTFIFMVVLNPLWHVHALNKFPVLKNKKVILCINHLSAADPFVALGPLFPHDGSWIGKAVIFKVPLGGWGLRNAGDLAVQFKDKSKGFDVVKGTVGPMMEEARKKLRRGRMVCVYPEGTRNLNPEGPVAPFRPGFFRLAIEEGGCIVPLAMSGSEKLWPVGSKLMDSADVYFTFGEPIEASKFANAEELAEHTRKVIDNLRETHPDRIALRAANERKNRS